ncbi:MAG: xanthine dehydrogenase family protein subunit M, partial [Betaproteobacteria bacterium]|nr:xanthine dehydrogenase family protein subunit M [Betaproteobacteria bacterium]
MKAPAFAYHRASGLVEALRLLEHYGDAARVLAGGQSLLPALNLRLTHPQCLIDISELAELRGETLVGSVIELGALTTHRALACSAMVGKHLPLLAMAVP